MSKSRHAARGVIWAANLIAIGLVAALAVSTTQPALTQGDVSSFGTFTATMTSTPTPTATPTLTPTATPTETPSPTPTETPTETPTPEPSPTNVPTETPTPVPTETPTEMPTETPTPAPLPTETPTESPTEVPADTPWPTATLENAQPPSEPPPTQTEAPTPEDTSEPATATPDFTPEVATLTPTLLPDTPTAPLSPEPTSTPAPDQTEWAEGTLTPTPTPTYVPGDPPPALTEVPGEMPTETFTPTPIVAETPTEIPVETPTPTITLAPTATEVPYSSMISVYMVPGNIRPVAGDVLSLSLVLDPRMVEVYDLEARCHADPASTHLIGIPDVNLALFAAESQVTIGTSESEDVAWVVSIAQPADAMPVTRKDVAISGEIMVLEAGEATIVCSVRAALSDGQLWDIPVAPLTLIVEERPVVGRIVGTVWRAWGSHAAQTGHAGIVVSLFSAAAGVADPDSPEAPIATTQTLEDGSFALPDVPAGRYRIRASDDGDRASLPVEGTIDLMGEQHTLLPPVVLPWGDINGDGQIDELDVVTIAGLYGSTVPPALSPADFDGDGRIGLLELSVLASNLRRSADSW